MSRYLPDRYPLFWEEIKRRTVGRRARRIALMGRFLLTGVAAGLVLFLLGVRGGFDIEFWHGLMTVQEFMVMLLAPALAVGAFTAERERGSLDFLFLTPMSTRSLVMQKFGGACVLLPFVILFFLPGSLIVGILGHIGPAEFATVYLLQLLRGIAFVAFGLMVSTLARNTRVATATTYTGIFLFEYAGRWLLVEQGLSFLAENDPSRLTALLTGPLQMLFALLPYLLITGLALWISTCALERQRVPIACGVGPGARTTHAAPPLAHVRWYLPNGHPVFWDDLRRRLRGGRTFSIMLGFALVLCIMLVAISQLVRIGDGPEAWPQFGNTLFYYSIIGQALMVTIISPSLTALAFSSDREARRIDFLFITGLTLREMVLGKYFGALALLLLTIVCGAPVMAIIAATFGGVSPWEFAAGYGFLMLSGLFCASTALLYSCKAKNSLAALVQGYLISILGMGAMTAMTFICFIGPIWGIIEVVRNLNHTVKRLENWQRNREEDPYAIPMLKGEEESV